MCNYWVGIKAYIVILLTIKYPEILLTQYKKFKWNKQIKRIWPRQFGIDYIDRNKSESLLNSNIAMWSKMLRSAHDIKSVRELGCNIGSIWLYNLKPNLEDGYEINEDAINKAKN